MVYIILWANCVARSYKYVDDDDGKQAMVDFQQSGYQKNLLWVIVPYHMNI